MEKFITEDVWNEVNNLISKYNSKKLACISYVSTSNLNLIKSDVLICDASENSINQGHTSVKALKTYLELGVEIFSLEELHSKLLVSGDYLVIGSANLSENSAENLIESAIITNNKSLINETITFVNMLIGKSEKISLERMSVLFDIRPLNIFSDRNLQNSNRKRIFQPNIEIDIEKNTKFSYIVISAEIRKNMRGEYVYLVLAKDMFVTKNEKKHIYNTQEIEIWKEAISKNKYLNVYGTYIMVSNLPKFYTIKTKTSNESTELEVFVLCDKDGKLLEDPNEVATGKLNSKYYKIL